MNGFLNFIRFIILGPGYFWSRYLIRKAYRGQVNITSPGENSAVYDKSFYRENLREMTVLPYFPFCSKVTTGGTTGEPFVFYMDTFWTRQKERAYIHDIWSYVGYKPFDLRVVFRGNSTGGKIRYNFLENSWNIPANYAVEENRGEILSFLKRIGGFYLHVYPSSLDTFVQFLGEGEFNNLDILGVFAGSESFPLNKMKSFQEKFGIKIAHWYGHSEYALLARYCHRCEEFHFYPTYGRLSFRGSGESREIVATSFNKLGTRFINYATGDYATQSQKNCEFDCFPKVREIVGRNQEYFYCKENKYRAFGPFLFGIHGAFWEKISSIQFLHEEKGKLLVRLRCSNVNKLEVEEYLTARFSLVDLEFDYDSSIEKTKLGKHKYFINKVSE